MQNLKGVRNQWTGPWSRSVGNFFQITATYTFVVVFVIDTIFHPFFCKCSYPIHCKQLLRLKIIILLIFSHHSSLFTSLTTQFWVNIHLVLQIIHKILDKISRCNRNGAFCLVSVHVTHVCTRVHMHVQVDMRAFQKQCFLWTLDSNLYNI